MSKPSAWTHETPHGWVVSKTKLTHNSVPLYTAEAAAEMAASKLGAEAARWDAEGNPGGIAGHLQYAARYLRGEAP